MPEKPEAPELFKYELLSNNTYRVSAGDDSTETDTLNIPETYKGKAVTEIADNGFSRNNNWTSISIPKSVVKIGASAFMNCSATITIDPGSLKTIDRQAFSESSTLVWNSTETSNWRCSFSGDYTGKISIYRYDGESYRHYEYLKAKVYRNVTIKDGDFKDVYFSASTKNEFEKISDCSNPNYNKYYMRTVPYNYFTWEKIER